MKLTKNLRLTLRLALGLALAAVLTAQEATDAALPPEQSQPVNAAVTPEAPPAPGAQNPPVAPSSPVAPVHHDDEIVEFGRAAKLKPGHSADTVVAIMGNAESTGTVHGEIVSVLGRTRVTGGSVGSEAVAIFGGVYINGHVQGEVVAVFGDVELGPEAIVDGNVSCVGGHVYRDPAAQVGGEISVFGGNHELGGLAPWFEHCVLQGRLLAFAPGVHWAWLVALGFLAAYVFVAWLAPASVRQCVQTLEDYPGKSILAAGLALVLTPLAYGLLAFTVLILIGLLLIPVFSVGLFCIGLFGKLVMLAWLGRRLTRSASAGLWTYPAMNVLVGGLVVTVIYCIPWAGMLTYKVLDILGVGVVIYTLILAAGERKTPAPPPAMASVENPVAAESAPPPLSANLPPVISAATLPRAGFWLRLAATLLDVILIGMASLMLAPLGAGFPLWLVLYFVVMWATKGTTVGGIICGLKLVRVDDRPMTWSVAVVRVLGAFLSLIVAGLGFLWVAWDDERQSWHDKIAGTTMVKVPKGISLL